MAEDKTFSRSPEASQRFLTFKLDRRIYALPAEQVTEVIRPPIVARVPQAPSGLVGLINLRGTILPLASLRGMLGLAEKGEDAGSRAIILDGAKPAALLVDGVEAFVTVESGKIETRSSELRAEDGEPITGAFDVPGRGIAKIIDIASLLDRTFTQRARPRREATVRSVTEIKNQQERVETDTLITFDVADQEYALTISAVREVVPVPDEIASLPHSEAVVVGMMSLRDHLLPLLSLRRLLGFPSGESNDRERVIVAAVGGATVGLIADRSRAVLLAERDLIDPIPSVLAARSGGESRIGAIYRGEGGKRLISILQPDQLFREEIMQRLETGQTAGATDMAEGGSAERQFLVFRLGDDEFALPIETVVEVAHVPAQITRVPKTPKFLEGVVNLRGQVLPVVDQRRRFDMQIAENQENRRLIVVQTERNRAGLIVDGVSEVLRSVEDAIGEPPDLTGDINRLVHGVINLEEKGRIILLLDPSELLTRAERGLLDAFEKDAKST